MPRSPVRRFALRSIETYQSEVSHRLGTCCRFETSCSHYGHDAFTHHSTPVATVLVLVRLLRCNRRSVDRAWRIAAAGAVLAVSVLALPMLVDPAGAQSKGAGSCTASLAGSDAFAASTPKKAIVVSKDSSAVASGTMATGPVKYTVQLEFAGTKWTVASGTGTDNSWTDEIKVNDYAKYGVGIYKVHAISTNAAGEKCTLNAFIKVSGSPLSSRAGQVAAGAMALGTIGVAVPTALQMRKAPKVASPGHPHGLGGPCGWSMLGVAMVMTASAMLGGKGIA